MEKIIPAWKKWDGPFMDFFISMSNEIIRSLKPKDADPVLNIAEGLGEPGLTIVTMLKGGKVLFTDLTEEILGIARENATILEYKNKN